MDLWAGVSFFFGQFEQAVPLARLAFFADLARRRARHCPPPGSSGSASSAAAACACARLWRALFPRRIVAHRSNQADIGYLFFNVFVFGVVFGWAVLSYQFVSNGIIEVLNATFGRVAPSVLPAWATRSVITVMLFLAYELGYWFNHWLCHKVPLLWEFHKVHHTAEVLTPLTNFRVHPVYTWVFANILALSAAIANGLGNYMFGDDRLSIRARRHQHRPGAVHPHLRAPAALAHVDFVSRRARAHLRLAGAPSGASLRPTRNTSTRISAVAWRSGTGCSARFTCRRRNARGSRSVSKIIPTRIRSRANWWRRSSTPPRI